MKKILVLMLACANVGLVAMQVDKASRIPANLVKVVTISNQAMGVLPLRITNYDKPPLLYIHATILPGKDQGIDLHSLEKTLLEIWNGDWAYELNYTPATEVPATFSLKTIYRMKLQNTERLFGATSVHLIIEPNGNAQLINTSAQK